MPSQKPARPVAIVPADRRQSERPSPATSGRCGFCGSKDTYSVVPEGFHEWAMERWGDAALLRCHDCGRRQAVAGLAPSRGAGADFRATGGFLRLAAWTLGVVGAAVLLILMLRSMEQGPSQTGPFRLPREAPRQSPGAPAPSPSSGPFSLRSIPTSAA
jgi:hypothetical protein